MMERYVFYGAVRSRSLRDICEWYVKQTGGELLFYVDDSIVVQEGDNVFPPEKIRETPDAVIVILSSAIKGVSETIRKLGLNNQIRVAPLLAYRFICDSYENPLRLTESVKRFADTYENDLRVIFDNNDDYTKAFLDQRMTESREFGFFPMDLYDSFEYEEYLVDGDISPKGNITLLDCGAYIGDSIEQIYKIYGSKLKCAYAFEPDKENMAELESKLGGNIGFVLRRFQCGVYDSEGTLRFVKVGDELERNEAGDIVIKTTTIDKAVDNKDIVGTLVIKMDLEGSEINALRGATQTIQRYRPYIVTCAYHHMNDLVRIPKTIRGIDDSYTFFIRAGIHTEIYAIPT